MNRRRSGIVLRPPVRSSTLLLSLAVHGAVVVAALGLGVYASTSAWRPPARIGVVEQQTPPVERTITELPEVLTEEPVEQPLLRDVEVPLVEAPAQESTDAERPIVAEVVRRTYEPTLERLREPAREPQEAATPPPQPVVAQEVAQPSTDAEPLDDNAPPDYPERERRRGREAEVVLAVAVDRDGNVQNVALRRPSRYAAFNREALRAVRKWRFEPARRLGVAVASETEVTVEFRLR